MLRPISLSGFLPAWDVERRRCDVGGVVEWTLERLAQEGLKVEDLAAIDVDGAHALELARRLTVASIEPAFRDVLHARLRSLLPELPWERVWVQTYAHFRILVPGDSRPVVRAHTDYGFAHGLDERNIWIALTNARGVGALHLLPFEPSMRMVVREEVVGALYDVDALSPVEAEVGDALLFTPLHVHGARPPLDATRVSIDVRIVPARTRPDLTFAPLRPGRKRAS